MLNLSKRKATKMIKRLEGLSKAEMMFGHLMENDEPESEYEKD